MKTLGITIAIVFCTMQIFASELVLNSSTSRSFRATINGITYTSQSGIISIPNLRPNSYRITISTRRGSSHHSLTTTEFIQIPANSIVHANVLPNNRLDITRIATNRVERTHVEYGSTSHCRTEYIEREMSRIDFDNLYTYLNDIKYDENRIRAAERAVSNEKFNSNQAYDIVSLFNFEEYRLEIAKNLYDNTVDKSNFYKIFELLQFESSKRELDNYMDSPGYYRAPSYSYSYSR